MAAADPSRRVAVISTGLVRLPAHDPAAAGRLVTAGGEGPGEVRRACR